jgi:glycosyltransferase involved in cell wall biosynthesis
VIIPARDEERYVGAALASVAAQTWPVERLEAIVVDNGSMDATAEVVRAFAVEHPTLAVQLLAEPAPGVSRAKNRGAARARGAWLLFLDADSRMAPDLAERIVCRGRDGYPAGSIRIIADSRDLLDRAFFGLMEFGKNLFKLHAQMLYCARDLFIRAGGFGEGLRLAEDREFLIRIQREGASLCRLTESWIATSPRRLRRLPFRLSMATTLIRWGLANWGIGRRWPY